MTIDRKGRIQQQVVLLQRRASALFLRPFPGNEQSSANVTSSKPLIGQTRCRQEVPDALGIDSHKLKCQTVVRSRGSRIPGTSSI